MPRAFVVLKPFTAVFGGAVHMLRPGDVLTEGEITASELSAVVAAGEQLPGGHGTTTWPAGTAVTAAREAAISSRVRGAPGEGEQVLAVSLLDAVRADTPMVTGGGGGVDGPPR